jgi:hypothetical protein
MGTRVLTRVRAAGAGGTERGWGWARRTVPGAVTILESTHVCVRRQCPARSRCRCGSGSLRTARVHWRYSEYPDAYSQYPDAYSRYLGGAQGRGSGLGLAPPCVSEYCSASAFSGLILFHFISWRGRGRGRSLQLVWQGLLVVTSKTYGTSPLFHLRAFIDSDRHEKALYDSTQPAAYD